MAAITNASSPFAERDRLLKNRALVRGWLYVALVVIFAVIVVGGATRLTDSGLSITEWKPIHGIVPPLNEAEWQEEFLKYQQIPQYKELNPDMDLAGFKAIFWWEWAHRLLARWAGVIFFALPFAFFWATRRLERGLAPKLAGIFALGGVQGVIGWLMVASGLTDRTSVHPAWLAVHLTVASLIFTATMLVARGLAPHSAAPADRPTQRFAGILILLILFQIFLGGLVAGLDAGLSYNTWPLMDGRVIPGDMLVIEPAWRNLFENPKTVQFIHRLGAYVVLAAALWHMIAARRAEPGTTHARRALLLFHLVLLQAIVGVATLLTQVNLHAALTHQALALVVLGFAAAHWRGTKGAYPLPTEIVAAR
ncbi:COX15/CtaA family protein [Mesorhizobium sp. LHD-90]|uniref:COX15/CtaA family protein n=1 Tax=Mesorhizobium sp. LHD-90 TaxID=3071414 RepID=UPI0027E05BE3|nr:COX15/CtaA family protein [Mesorhizobium sp. LHD-90]MDQ6434581.1 COX15/CtaA family protein [Mesorhizobium sp. LHD-90]